MCGKEIKELKCHPLFSYTTSYVILSQFDNYDKIVGFDMPVLGNKPEISNGAIQLDLLLSLSLSLLFLYILLSHLFCFMSLAKFKQK